MHLEGVDLHVSLQVVSGQALRGFHLGDQWLDVTLVSELHLLLFGEIFVLDAP